jgi:hypothetical protein
LISKKSFIKKDKASLSTQGVYTGITKAIHKKKPKQTYKALSLQTQNPQRALKATKTKTQTNPQEPSP